MLLDKGVAVNPSSKVFKTTPLIMACLGINADIVRVLLAKGAETNAKDSSGGSALTAAIVGDLKSNDARLVRLLLKEGADVRLLRCTPRCIIITNSSVIKVLQEHGADLSQLPIVTGK